MSKWNRPKKSSHTEANNDLIEVIVLEEPIVEIESLELLEEVHEAPSEPVLETVVDDYPFFVDYLLVDPSQTFLVVTGWTPKPDDILLTIRTNDEVLVEDVTCARFFRFDWKFLIGADENNRYGFIALIPLSGNLFDVETEYELIFTSFNSNIEVKLAARIFDGQKLEELRNVIPALDGILLERDSFSELVPTPLKDHVYIDRCIKLANGYLVYGWSWSPSISSMTVLGDKTKEVFPVVRYSRKDLYHLQENNLFGFMTFMPLVRNPKIPLESPIIEIVMDNESRLLFIKSILFDETIEKEVESFISPFDYQVKQKMLILRAVWDEVSLNEEDEDEPTFRYSLVGGLSPEPYRTNVVIPLYKNFSYVKLQSLLLSSELTDKDCVTFVCDDQKIEVNLEKILTAVLGLYKLNFQLILNNKNYGFATACNLGASAVNSKYIVFMNSDVIPDDRGWLEELISYKEKGPKRISCIAPVMTFPTGSIQHAGLSLSENTTWPGFVFPRNDAKGLKPSADKTPIFAEFLSGVFWLVTKADWEAVGGIPTIFRKGDFEDILFSEKLKSRGALCLYPSKSFVHYEGESHDDRSISTLLYKSILCEEQLTKMRSKVKL